MDKVCPICKKTFSSSTCLPLHMLIHTGEKPHKCDLCGKAFRQKNHVQSHKMYNHRSEQQTVVGDDKRNLFKRYPKYKSAVLSRKKNLNPTVVGDDKRNPFKIYTKYKSAVLSRKKNLNPTVVGDDKRDPGSKIYPKYNSAVLSRKKNVYSFLCRQCPRRFLTDDQRLRHECLHERPSSERSVCELCSGVYHTGRGIERHREGWCRGRTTSPRKPVQPREENRTTSPRKPVQPREEKLATEECPKCGQKFATAQNLQRHLSTIHQKRGGEAFQCSVCDGSFLSSRVLSMHLISGNCLRKDESPGEECPKCGQKFATAHNLQRHLSTIHQKRVGKAFRCPGCDGRFLSSGVLSRHLNSGNCQREDSSVASGSSTNEPTSSRSRYPCSCCGSSFGSEMALQQHLKCQHCRVQFVRPKSFHKHFQHCGAKAKSKHSCFKCRKTFKFSSLLSKHQAQTSCGSIEDRFHCSVCEKHFSTKEMLRRHELWSHELERLAQRPGSSTKTQPTKLHKGEDVDEEPDQSHSGVKSARNIFEAAFKIKRESEVAGARLYECAVCTAKFKFSQGIKRHNAMHEDPADKPFVCSACRGRFRTHMGFTKHRRNCQLIDRNTPIKIPSHSDMDEDDEFSDIPPINNPDASAAVIDESEESSVASSVGDNSSTTSRNGEMNEIEVDDVPDHEGSRNESGGVMKSRLVCRHCDVEFVYSKSYQAHVNLCETRSEGRQFPCTRCPRTFNSRTALNRHRKDHKENYASKARPKFACPKCRKTFRYLSLFVRHQKTCRSAHHRFRFPWQRNGKANEGASEPRKDENVGQAIFHLSGNKVKSDRNVFEMMKRSPDKDKGPFVCTFCSAEYPSRLSLANHRRIHERSDDRTIVCSACGGRFLSLSALKRHQYYCKTIRRKLPRTNRNSEIGSEDELSDGSDEPAIEDADLSDDSVEQAVEDDELADVDSMFTGVTSDAEIGNEDKQESGVARVGEHSSRTPMYDEWNADKFACSVCNATFETEKAHKRHLKCRNCGIKFVSAKMYHEHFQGCQAKAEPPMPCPGCQKPFKSSMHLSCHLDTCEWSDGSFSCSVCRGKFSNKCELRFHKRTHGKVVHREMSFSCPGCLETFTNSCKFDSHVESCEGIDGIPCCSDCGELLTTSKLLRDHQLRDKDHGKTFVPPLGISEIGGKDFGVDASKISSHVPVANAGETSTKRSMVSYECGVCLNQFKNRRLRDQHAEVHRNVASKPYSCTSCRGGFWNVDALAKHKRFCGMNKPGTVAPLSETRPVKGAGFLNRRKSAPLPNSSTTNRAGSSAADGDSRTLTAVVRPFGPRRGKRPWPCDVCSKSFDSARGRSIHRSRHNKPSVGHDNVPGFTKVTAETAKTAAERKLPFYIELIDPPSVSSDDTVVELESALYSTSAEPSSVVATSDDDNNNVPRSCIKCQYTTNIWSELQAHIGRCFESYDNSQYRLCLPCCKLFPKETITTHKRECESSPYQCRVCYIRFPALHELRSHIRAEHRVLSGDERFEKPDYSPTSDGKERTEPPLDQRFLLELVDVTPLEESDVAMTDDEESRDRDMFTPVIESTQTMDPAQWDSAPAQTQLTNGSPSSRNSSPQKVVRFEVNAFKALLSNIAANETLETESSAQLMTSDEFVSEETVCSVCSIVFENAEKLADHIGKDHVCLD